MHEFFEFQTLGARKVEGEIEMRVITLGNELDALKATRSACGLNGTNNNV